MAEEPTAAPPAGPDRRSPEEWERMFFPASDTGRASRDAWKHAAASSLHGWAVHAYHANAPMLLTRGDYEAALEAASNLRTSPSGTPTYLPHEAALSPYAPRPAAGTDAPRPAEPAPAPAPAPEEPAPEPAPEPTAEPTPPAEEPATEPLPEPTEAPTDTLEEPLVTPTGDQAGGEG